MIRRGKQKAKVDERSNIQCYLLPNRSTRGPLNATKPYASISILDPLITIERHHGKYHVAARFNIETSILNYENQTRDGHEYFFQDICLQYLSPWADEELSMKPESDPSAALTVTRGTETNLSGNASLALSQTPSANVSLGLTRSKMLTVEHALATWSLSAHRITDVTPWKEKAASQTETPTSGPKASNESAHRPFYQWFWAGTHEHTKTLTPDLKYTVKRHVVTKRAIPVALFPSREEKEKAEWGTSRSNKDGSKTNDTVASGEGERVPDANVETKIVEGENYTGHTLESLLDFSFRVQVRVKQRFGRFHRVLSLSGNEVKGKLMKPLFEQVFRLRAKPEWDGVPENNTLDISTLLNQIKQDCDGNYEDLTDNDFFEMSNAYIVTQAEQSTETHMGFSEVQRAYETSG